MLQTYEAVFKNGQVCFKTPPKGVKPTARLLVTFLDPPAPVRKTARQPHGSIEKAIAALQETFSVPGRSLVAELIAERRRNAAHE